MIEQPAQTQIRLDALERYDVLDTPQEESFDRITRLTRRVFDVPMSTVTFLDGHRQWFKSRQGLADQETEREPAFCRIAIEGSGMLVVSDAAEDERFRTNRLVVGPPFIRFYAGVPLRTPEGIAIGTLCAIGTEPRAFTRQDAGTLADLGATVMELLDLRLQATSDPLTGLMTRRAFRDEAGRALALARRHRHDLACLVVDIDHFKRVNDTYGHLAGDEVLKAFAAACRSELRDSDVIGRIGGEEFAVFLPLTGSAGAADVAERLRAAVARLRIPTSTGPIAVSASFGISLLDRSMTEVDDLLSRADSALYQAKNEGRNRCCQWRTAAEPIPGGRRRVFKAGRIAFNAGHSTIDCTVRALSDAEAALDVISSAAIPETFKLQIEADGLSRACRIVSKGPKRLEVAFE